PSGGAPPSVPAGGGALAALDPGAVSDTALAATPGEPAGDGTEDGTEDGAGRSASPRFDVVRVAPDGMAVIAGQAAPRSRVELLIDGEATMSADVDDSGSFAIVADIGTTDAPRTLQLRLEDAASGGDTALAGAAIQITSAEAAELAASPTADVAQPVAPTDDEPAGEAPEQGPAPDTALAGLSAPVVLLPRLDDDAGAVAAPTAVRAGAERVALIAPGATTVPRLVLDTLSYVEGQDGMAIGRAPGAARIRVFVNNAPATEIRASDQGAWTAAIPAAMMRRARLLRFEQVGDGGEVVYRLETRFSYREAGATLALRERTITVARGDSLWRLAENIYGEGWRYSVIFGANDGLIRDPDLIYPEQEFVIPELVDDPASR
ncbi:MAG: LysM peptidoglycan-binding domain-containing protein, partial [Pseudomonadota bacterium]